MATLTLKNVPDDLHRRLKERAERNRRSLNREAIHVLETGMEGERPNFSEAYERFRTTHSADLLDDPTHDEIFGDVRSHEMGRPSPFETDA